MKMFLSADINEAEIFPKARVAYIRVHNRDGIIGRYVVIRTPLRRWVKYLDPWSFGPTAGWCTFTFWVTYRPRDRKFQWMSIWEPV